MKLSEIVKPQARREALDSISYCWHKTGGKSARGERYAFVIAITGEILNKARFREGDNADISFESDTMQILLSPELPFSLCLRYKNDKARQMKVSSRGVENVAAVLPNVGHPVKLEVISTEIGKITVRIPKL